MSTYTITDSTLTIADPEAFGFEGSDIYENPEWSKVADEYLHDRRTYNIRRVVIKHEASGRFFATEYSTHEDEGMEWGPGMGRTGPVRFREVFPHQVTVTVYKSERPS